MAPLLCVVTVCKIRLLGGRVLDVKYPCSCVAFSPFPSHHLGLAHGVLFLCLPLQHFLLSEQLLLLLVSLLLLLRLLTLLTAHRGGAGG